MSPLEKPLIVAMFEPIIASQPCKDGNQYAKHDEEAERDHPYPQPVALMLFLQPGLAVSQRSAHLASFEHGRSCMVEEDVRVSELRPR